MTREIDNHRTGTLTPRTQYRLAKILGLWIVATVPMVVIGWVLIPWLAPIIKIQAVQLYWFSLLINVAWQSSISLWIIRREEGDLRWETIRRRVWLNAPLNPRTDEPQNQLFWRLLPCILLALVSLVAGIFWIFCTFILMGFVNSSQVKMYLSQVLDFAQSHEYANVVELVSPAFAGQWGWLVTAMVIWVLNAFLAEELLFRGVLLPKMRGVFGRLDWVANAILNGLYFLHKPWMIPFRTVDALITAGPARRFRSNWMAVIVRGVEGVLVLLLLLMGVLSPSMLSAQVPTTFPSISQRPIPLDYGRETLTSLPHYNPDSGQMWQVDLRSLDLSALDLRNASSDLMYADFDDRTLWPPVERMPSDFDPKQIMELGKNPGLGLRQLHAQGITGRSVGIAIIDQPLLTGHQEYVDRLQWYEQYNVSDPGQAAMHSPAVASIAVGKTVGVAPEAYLYYIAIGSKNVISFFDTLGYYAQGIRRVLQINAQLPPDREIRVISMSIGFIPAMPGAADFMAAVKEAEAAGVYAIFTNQTPAGYVSLAGRSPLADPDILESYEISLMGAKFVYANMVSTDVLLIPVDSRTFASPTGDHEYVFYRTGGLSWMMPYAAGLYALAVQVDPSITPDRFWTLAKQTARPLQVQHEGKIYYPGKMIDPMALIQALQRR